MKPMESPVRHCPTSTPSPPFPQHSGQLTPRTGRPRGTVSPVCYCVQGAKPADSVGYSEGQAEKRLGSLASCCRSEPRPAWSVKPCQMEPFSKQWELRRRDWETGGWMLWGRRGWAFIYSRWHVRFMICRDSFLGHQHIHLDSKVLWFCL